MVRSQFYAITLILFIGLFGLACSQSGGQVPCRNVSPNVQKFTNIFVNGILNSMPRNLTDEFTEQHLTSEQAGKIYNGLVTKVDKDLKNDETDISSKILSDAVAKNFDKITPLVFLQNYAKNTGQTMELLGKLNDGNSENLAKEFLKVSKKHFLSETSGESQAMTQLISLVNGLEDFLIEYDALTIQTVPIFVTIYAQEWYTLV